MFADLLKFSQNCGPLKQSVQIIFKDILIFSFTQLLYIILITKLLRGEVRGGGEVELKPIAILLYKRKIKSSIKGRGVHFYLGKISFGKMVVKEDHIVSSESKVLRNSETDPQTFCYFYLKINCAMIVCPQLIILMR